MTNEDFEYIVVGSGAGGGTVAARLAQKGRRVLLLEAGGDPVHLQGGDEVYPDKNRLPADYQVPVFHAISTENFAMRWEYFVRHYTSDVLQKRDLKYTEEWDGERVGRGLLPARRLPGRLHRPQRHDHRLPRQRGLELRRDLDRRQLLVGRQHAEVLPEAGELPPPTRLRAGSRNSRLEPHQARLRRLAADRVPAHAHHQRGRSRTRSSSRPSRRRSGSRSPR